MRPAIKNRRLPIKKRDARRRGKQRGISLTEAILGVAVLGVGLGSIASLQVDNIQNIKVETSAQQLAIVREGAERFVRDNIAAIQAGIPAAGDTAIIPDQQLDGWLPPAVFNGGEIRANPYGQDTVVSVRNMGIGPTGQTRVGVFVTTRGGQVIPDEQLASIAAAAGAQAGFRVAADGLYDGDTIQGAYGAWQIATADLEAGAEPSPGGLAAVAYFGEGGVLADFLYRNPVPGQPQAQQMNANIDMNDFGIASLRQINGTIDTAVTGNAPAPVLPVAGTPVPPDVLMVGDVNAASANDDYARGGAGLYAGEVRSETVRTEGFVNSLSQVVTGQLDAAGAPTGANVAISAGLDETGAAAADPRVGMRVVDAAANERIAAVVDDGAGFSGVRLFDDALNETVTIDGQSRETIFRDDANLARVRVASAGGEIAVSDGDVADLGAAGGLAGLRMRGSGMFDGFDSSGRLRSRLDAETATFALQDDAGVESVFVDGQGRQLVMRDDANLARVRVASAGGEIAVSDGDVADLGAPGGLAGLRMRGAGLFEGFDSGGRLRSRLDAETATFAMQDDAGVESVFVDGQGRQFVMRDDGDRDRVVANGADGSIVLNRLQGGATEPGLQLLGNQRRIRFGEGAAAGDWVELRRSTVGGQPEMRMQIANDSNPNRAFSVGIGNSGAGGYRPRFRTDMSGRTQFSDSANRLRAELRANDAALGLINDAGTLRVGLDGQNGNIGLADAAGTTRFVARSDIGATEHYNAAGTATVSIDGRFGAINHWDGTNTFRRIVTNGTDASTRYFDNAGTERAVIDGQGANILLSDSAGRLGVVINGQARAQEFRDVNNVARIALDGASGNARWRDAAGTARIDIGATSGEQRWNNASGATTIQAIGDTGIITAGGLFLTSDETLKQDIIPVEDALERIRKLDGVQFNWKDTGAADVGLIAQNVAEIFPELVMQRDDGKMVVKYPSLIGALVEAIKELDIKSQDSALDELIREKVRADREQFANLLNPR